MLHARLPSSPARVLLTLLALFLAVALAAPATSVGAQGAPPSTAAPQQPAGAAPPAATPGQNTWALSPSSTNANEASSRAFFSYELPPESDIQDSATVWNYSDEERTFNVYARDAFNTEEGGFDVQAGGQQPTGTGSWVKMSREQVTVPPRSGVPVPFTLTVPLDATRGDHAAGIVASLATSGAEADAGGRKVMVDHRAGSRIYLRVPGPLTPALTVEQVDVAYHGTANPVGKGEADVTYTIKNTGNVRLRGTLDLELTGIFGIALQERGLPEVPDLLPGSAITRTEHLTDVLPAIRDSADIQLTPLPAKDGARDAPPVEPMTRSASSWAVPWTLLLLLVAIIVLIVMWRRRRRRAPASPAVAAAPDLPMPVGSGR